MSYYDEASLITLFTGAAGNAGGNGGGKIASIKPVEKITGSELVTNGDFSITIADLGVSNISDGWRHLNSHAAASVAIEDGVAKIKNGAGTDSRLYATNGTNTNGILTANTDFKLVYTVVENKGVTVFKYYTNGGFYDAPSNVGTHSIIIRNKAVNNLFLFRNSTANSEIHIDNVSIKKLEQAPFDWDMDRSTNLGASRINKDGLIERGRTQLLYNTPWVQSGLPSLRTPDGWTTAGALNGAFTDTNAQGQVTFSAVDAYVDDDNKGDRRYFVSPTISTLGVYAQSVYVDAVVGNVRIKDIMRTNSANNTTIIQTFAGNTRADGDNYIEAGKRYTRIYSLDSSTTVFRYGIGTNPIVEPNVSVTLSRPQLEKGHAPSTYIENKNTSATQDGGLLVDEPRFDYPLGGGTPSLLIEGDRQNLLLHSAGKVAGTQDVTTTVGYGLSPEGIPESLKVLKDGVNENDRIRVANSGGITSLDTTKKYTISAFVKNISCSGSTCLATRMDDASNTLFRQSFKWASSSPGASLSIDTDTGHGNQGTRSGAFVEDYGNGWWRIGFTFTPTHTTASFEIDVDRNDESADETTAIETWGWQYELGEFASSYIHTNGAAVTRATDDGNTFMKLPTENPERYTVFVDLSQEDTEATNMGVRGDNSSASIDTLFGYFIPSADGGKTFFFDGNDNTTRTFSHNISDCPTDTKFAFTVDNVSQTVRLYVNGALEQNEDMGQRADLNQLRLSGNDNGAAQRTRTVMFFTQELSITEGKIITGDASDTFAELAEANNYTLHV